MPRSRIANHLSIGFCLPLLIVRSIVDSSHEEHILGIIGLRADALSASKKSFDGFIRNAEVGYIISRKSPLQVEPLRKRITHEDELQGV